MPVKLIMVITSIILSFLMLFCNNVRAYGQDGYWRKPPMPQDMANVDIYIGTRDVGHLIYTKYGHTIVRVVDKSSFTDIGYNWGTFDFNAPGFVPNFLRGLLIYQMSFGPWRNEVEVSRLENQTMWMERVNLTDRQKKTVLDKIMWQSRPENVNYPYLFFYDNCSTRVRDLLDLAVNGQIKARTSARSTGRTYRDRVMEHNASAPFFAMGQDLILNSEPDKVMSEWEDMFIPGRLREYLMRMPAFDDLGQEIPGKTFLSDTVTLTEFPGPQVPMINGYLQIWLIAGVPSLLGLILIRTTKLKKIGARLVGLSCIVLGSLWGAVGLFLAASWIFGSHTVLPRNANLWMVWPTDILYAGLGVWMLTKGRFIDLTSPSGLWMRRYTMAHLVGIVVLCVLTFGDIIDQHTFRIVAWFAPLTALVWSTATTNLGLKESRTVKQ
jgi:hypothetical protein